MPSTFETTAAMTEVPLQKILTASTGAENRNVLSKTTPAAESAKKPDAADFEPQTIQPPPFLAKIHALSEIPVEDRIPKSEAESPVASTRTASDSEQNQQPQSVRNETDSQTPNQIEEKTTIIQTGRRPDPVRHRIIAEFETKKTSDMRVTPFHKQRERAVFPELHREGKNKEREHSPFIEQSKETRQIPRIQVTIGRIEVRAVQAPRATMGRKIRQEPSVSLNQYLKQRREKL